MFTLTDADFKQMSEEARAKLEASLAKDDYNPAAYVDAVDALILAAQAHDAQLVDECRMRLDECVEGQADAAAFSADPVAWELL